MYHDVRLQEFVHLCKLTKDRDDRDERILNMSNLIQGVIFGSFTMDLPPNTESIDYEKEVWLKEGGECKKRKPNPEEDGKRHITNDFQHTNLKMKENKVWKRDFVGKHTNRGCTDIFLLSMYKLYVCGTFFRLTPTSPSPTFNKHHSSLFFSITEKTVCRSPPNS